MFICFDVIHECDRHTDSHTRTQTDTALPRLCIASRGKDSKSSAVEETCRTWLSEKIPPVTFPPRRLPPRENLPEVIPPPHIARRGIKGSSIHVVVVVCLSIDVNSTILHLNAFQSVNVYFNCDIVVIFIVFIVDFITAIICAEFEDSVERGEGERFRQGDVQYQRC